METGERIFVSGEGGVCIDTDYCMVEVMFAVVGGMDLGDGGVISAFAGNVWRDVVFYSVKGWSGWVEGQGCGNR